MSSTPPTVSFTSDDLTPAALAQALAFVISRLQVLEAAGSITNQEIWPAAWAQNAAGDPADS